MLDNSLAVFAGHYMSGPVKFDEKSKFVKLVGNHSYYFLKWSHDDQQAMTLVESAGGKAYCIEADCVV